MRTELPGPEWSGQFDYFTRNFEMDLQKAAQEIPGLRISVAIEAPTGETYEALTTPLGIWGWWSLTLEGDVGQGSVFTVRFGETYQTLRVDDLQPNREVLWTCTESHFADGAFTRPDEWVGTRLRFLISESGTGGTDLLFIHEGLTPELECYELCEAGWNHYLRNCMKPYLENKVAQPFDNPLE